MSTEDSPESSTASLLGPFDSQTDKVVVWFRPTGSAPVLKQSKFKISMKQYFQAVIEFLRRQLRFQTEKDQLFLYLNSAFSPAPDEPIANLFRCFGVDGMLIVNYSITAAWG